MSLPTEVLITQSNEKMDKFFQETKKSNRKWKPITRFKQYSPDEKNGIAKQSMADQLTKEAIRAFNNHQRYKLIENLKQKEQKKFSNEEISIIYQDETPEKQLSTEREPTKLEDFTRIQIHIDNEDLTVNEKISSKSDKNFSYFQYSGLKSDGKTIEQMIEEQNYIDPQQTGFKIIKKDNNFLSRTNPIGLSAQLEKFRDKIHDLEQEVLKEEKVNKKIDEKKKKEKQQKLVSKNSSMNLIIISTHKKQQIEEVQKNDQYLPLLSTTLPAGKTFQLEDLLIPNNKGIQKKSPSNKNSFKELITARKMKNTQSSFNHTKSQFMKKIKNDQKFEVENILNQELTASAIELQQKPINRKPLDRLSFKFKVPLVSIKDASQNTSEDFSKQNKQNFQSRPMSTYGDERIASNSTHFRNRQSNIRKKQETKQEDQINLKKQQIIQKSTDPTEQQITETENDEEKIFKIDQMKSKQNSQGVVPEEEEGESEYVPDFEINESSSNSLIHFDSDQKENNRIYPTIPNFIFQDKIKKLNTTSTPKEERLLRLKSQKKLPLVKNNLKMVRYNSKYKNNLNSTLQSLEFNHVYQDAKFQNEHLRKSALPDFFIHNKSPGMISNNTSINTRQTKILDDIKSFKPQFMPIGKDKYNKYMVQTFSANTSPKMTYQGFNSNEFKFQLSQEPQWDYRAAIGSTNPSEINRNKKIESVLYQKYERNDDQLPQLFLPVISKNKQDLHRSIQEVVKQIFQKKNHKEQITQQSAIEVKNQQQIETDGTTSSSLFQNNVKPNLQDKIQDYKFMNSPNDRTAVLKQLKKSDGVNQNQVSDSSLKNFGELTSKDELEHKYQINQQGLNTQRYDEQNGFLQNKFQNKEGTYNILNTLEMKNSSLISLHPPSLSALMQGNSRVGANNLTGQKTHPIMQINSGSESSLNFGKKRSSPSIIDDLIQIMSDNNEPKKNDDTSSNSSQNQQDENKDKKHQQSHTNFRSPIAARKLNPSQKILNAREQQKNLAFLNQQLAIERMANLMHQTISPQLENIVKNQSPKKKERKLNTEFSNHSTLMINLESQPKLSPYIKFSPQIPRQQFNSELKTIRQTQSNFKLFDYSMIPKVLQRVQILKKKQSKKKIVQPQIMDSLIFELDGRESKVTDTFFQGSRGDLSNPSNRSLSPIKSDQHQAGFSTLLIQDSGCPSSLLNMVDQPQSTMKIV